MLHPNFSYISKIINGIFESLYIALFATIISSIFCLILSYFTACNNSRNKIISIVFKIFSNILRTFPPMIVAIIFFGELGPGKFVGVMALIVYTTGSMTKMYSEIIENVNSNIEDSIKSTGATNISIYYYALLKETYPSFLGIIFYRLESNIRNSTIFRYYRCRWNRNTFKYEYNMEKLGKCRDYNINNRNNDWCNRYCK